MDNWQKCVLNEESTVGEVIHNLNETSARIVLIVNSQRKFLGIVVDGDIRRGILNGVKLTDRVAEIINQKPITVSREFTRIDALAIMKTLQVLHIPIIDVDNRLIGVHFSNEIPSRESCENLFVIMAGGFGRRMGSLTTKTPKPMLEIAGKPILEHLIVRAKNTGFRNFVIATHYLAEVIENYFGDGSRLGVHVEYLRETEPLGTAGAIRNIQPAPTIPFLVSNADLVSNVDFAALLDFHQTQMCDATMAVRKHQWQNPFGVVNIVDGQINEIIEKPIIESNINAGVFVFNPAIVKTIGDGEFCDMPTLLQRLIMEKKKVFAFPLHEEWADIGHKLDLESVRLQNTNLIQNHDGKSD